MKIRNSVVLMTLILSGLTYFQSCTYKHKESLLDIGTCDTINTKFAAVIQPMINTSCNAQSGCHGANAGPRSLEDYQSVKNKYTDILSRIKSGNMPKNNPRLDDCSILQFQTWVNRGAQNN